jgi:hypothetical protein
MLKTYFKGTHLVTSNSVLEKIEQLKEMLSSISERLATKLNNSFPKKNNECTHLKCFRNEFHFLKNFELKIFTSSIIIKPRIYKSRLLFFSFKYQVQTILIISTIFSNKNICLAQSKELNIKKNDSELKNIPSANFINPLKDIKLQNEKNGNTNLNSQSQIVVIDKVPGFSGGFDMVINQHFQSAFGVSNEYWGSPQFHNVLPFISDLRSKPIYNNPLFMIGNGNEEDRRNAFEVSYNGHSIVSDVNGPGTATSFTQRGSIQGATYVDNVIYAWGRSANINPTSFGTYKIFSAPDEDPLTKMTFLPGVYKVVLNLIDKYGNKSELSDMCPVVTSEHPCYIPCITNVAKNSFYVEIFDNNCIRQDGSFSFIVTGRP